MNTAGTHTIRANSILPARRRDIALHTTDGVRLVGELALPLERNERTRPPELQRRRNNLSRYQKFRKSKSITTIFHSK